MSESVKVTATVGMARFAGSDGKTRLSTNTVKPASVAATTATVSWPVILALYDAVNSADHASVRLHTRFVTVQVPNVFHPCRAFNEHQEGEYKDKEE